MALLTEQEIMEIVREAARGSATRRDGSTSQKIARAIESKVIEKIKAQGPVGYGLFVDGKRVSIGQYRSSMSIGKKQVRSQPLYRLPEGD